MIGVTRTIGFRSATAMLPALLSIYCVSCGEYGLLMYEMV